MKNKITKAIGSIGYDIIDNFICKEMGISCVVADLYLCDIETYTDNEKQATKIRAKVLKKYGLTDKLLPDYMGNWPIALVALYIMENGNYFGKASKEKHFVKL